MKALRRISDGMVVLALVFAVVALLGPSWAWWVAGFCLLDSVVATVLHRRSVKARKAERAAQKAAQQAASES